MQAVRCHRATEIEVQYPRLDPRGAVLRVDLDDVIHLRRDDHNRIGQWCGAARQAGSTPPRNERPLVGPGHTHRGRNIRRSARPAHRERAARCRPRVARVQREFERLGARTVRAERLAKIS